MKNKITLKPMPSMFGFMTWLGGAVYVAHQPSMTFWDGIVWCVYVGRYIATHFTVL